MVIYVQNNILASSNSNLQIHNTEKIWIYMGNNWVESEELRFTIWQHIQLCAIFVSVDNICAIYLQNVLLFFVKQRHFVGYRENVSVSQHMAPISCKRLLQMVLERRILQTQIQ